MRNEASIEATRLIIAANRLPVQRVGDCWEGSPGGLVSALRSTAETNRALWIGWSGTTEEEFEPFEHGGIELVPLSLDETERERYYEGFANRTLWPLYHNAIRSPTIVEDWWRAYRRVNQRFARMIAETATPGDGVWVHDYHLQLVPSMLRELRPDLRIGFFLHTPFPPADLFRQLPWRRRILDGLLGADLLGFQTDRDRGNFLGTVLEHTAATRRPRGLEVAGRHVRVERHPISLDLEAFERIARDPATAERAAELRQAVGRGRPILLGVDRMDYSKGILRRLQALERLLEQGSLTAADFAYVQIAVPSREGIPEYDELRREIDRRVARVNGLYEEAHRPLIKYFRRGFSHRELVAWYRAADIMLVTPLRDGMNLVAKEYVATRYDGSGLLILSELAGAAAELDDAATVNPFDVETLAERILEAVRADAPRAEEDMREMRRALASHDIHDWTRGFLDSLFEVDPEASAVHGSTIRSGPRHRGAVPPSG